MVYKRLLKPNGLIEQWAVDLAIGKDQYWNFPIAFVNKPIAIGNSTRNYNYWNISAVTTTSVQVYQDSSGGTWGIYVKGY